jgi:uncharacterized protein (DUF1684 family)
MTDNQFDEATWRERLQQNRTEKDEFFAEDRRSPLSQADRESFDGLDYFDPDPEYRVTATATVHDDPIAVEMTVSNGDPTRFQRVVTFEFELPSDGAADSAEESAETDGETVTETLHGFRPQGDDSLFVPFRDKTTGQETYRGGRYMDLHPEGDLRDGTSITIDFNLAYTPFCAFSDSFACPLPPEENWLQTTVPAGERDPPVGE